MMDKLIIAFNKVDLFPLGVEDEEYPKQMKKLRGRFKHTKFGAYLPVVPVAAAPRVSEEESKEESKEGE